MIVAGQAKSHCVAWTLDDLLDGTPALGARASASTCSRTAPPVVVPGAVDFREEADAAFARFAEAGMHVVRSTDPIEEWPASA